MVGGIRKGLKMESTRSGGMGAPDWHMEARSPVKGVGPEDVRRRNRNSVLRLLYPDHWLSRADVAKLTGLSKSSASGVVTSLIDDGLIHEEGRRIISGPGKPAVLLHLDPNARQIIAIDVSRPTELIGVVTNLVGEIQARAQLLVNDGEQLDIDPIVELIEELRDELNAPLLGVGVASPGTVDRSGTVLKASNLGWENVPIAARLEERIGVGVRVDNNANAAALGEYQYGVGREDMMFVQIAQGVGAGMVLNDQVVVGTLFSAGEIGHVVVDSNGVICRCGKRGCLETMTSLPSLRKRLNAEPSERDRILTKAGGVLGQTLSMPIAMTGIDDIVISGDSEVIDDVYLAAVSYAVNSRIDEEFFGKITVRRTQLGSDIVLLGESVAVLRSMLL